MAKVAVIGAGLAGSEAALVLSRYGVDVDVYEMRPESMTPAHKTPLPAELVCSNSFKAIDTQTAHGQLKRELEILQSPLLGIARSCRVPAGSALAVDREIFSTRVLQALEQAGTCTLIRKQCSEPPQGYDFCIIAAGPLVSDDLAQWLARTFGSKSLSFYDAIAPIIDSDSLDMSICFTAARHDSESTDYINCPFTEQEYKTFYDALTVADKVVAHEFEQACFFEACLPVEVIASRGYLALAYGTMRPVGLNDPRTGRWPFAACQLRRETADGTAYSLVGFQSRLKMADQERVFRLIPGLGQAQFLRFGTIHRNSYLDSPRLLAEDLSFRAENHLFCAGQLNGGEGYTESIATGHLAALAVCTALSGERLPSPPPETALGALVRHITNSPVEPFAPGNCNFGIFPAVAPPLGRRKWGKKEKQALLCERATASLSQWTTCIPRKSNRCSGVHTGAESCR